MNDSTLPATHWPRIWIAFLAGCVGAFQIGKTFASLTLIIDDLALSLVEAGMVLSLFSLIAAFTGAGLGLLADRVGHLRMAISGLSLSAVGSFLGAMTQSIDMLLLTRLLEGFGFILAIVALPSLIGRSANERDRPLAMGLWGAFMPAGIGLSMLITPLLVDWHGWRGLWSDVGCMLLAWGLVLYLGFRRSSAPVSAPRRISESIAGVLRLAPLMVVTGFVCYSAMYQSLTAFLPTLLVTDYDVPLGIAARLGALVVVGNIIGNLSAGWLIGRGYTPWKLLLTSFSVMALCSVLVFSSVTDPGFKILAGFLFSAFGGMFPGTAFVLAARYSPSPAQMALLAGFLLQGAGLGQTIGPLMVSSVVELYGSWSAAIVVMLALTSIGLVCALVIRARPQQDQ